MRFKQRITHNLFNIPGWHTKRHIVVFESDDWGAIRMPSLEAFNTLRSDGGSVGDRYGYDRNDTLASNDDLELLMEVLSSVKDKNSNPAKITLNTCVANPDFNKIKSNGFKAYYYEPFIETLKRYPHHDRAFDLWKEGIGQKVFQPQFHGREHLNAQMWLQLLQNNNEFVKKAFEREVFSVSVDVPYDSRKHVLSAFNVIQESEYPFVFAAIKEGLDLFEQLFGYRSVSMIAPCYTWDIEIENVAFDNGVKVIQGSHAQIPSAFARSQGVKVKRHYTGQRNKNGQVYLVRTCNFEPTQSLSCNADNCMKEIVMDFQMRKPAIVSCHRLNFIGGLNPNNRDNNLRDFKKLLQMIVAKYPDVEFMSSDELGLLISHDSNK